MTTIITRKVYEPGGLGYILTDGKCKPLPPDVAYLRSGAGLWGAGDLEPVTWAEIMDGRRERQAERLRRIRHLNDEPMVCPCYVWTFFNRQMIPYYGWYCYVVSRHFSIAVNFRGYNEKLATSIMTAVPLGILPLKENFYKWMEAFAKAYPRAKHRFDFRKAGSRVGWITDRQSFTLEHPL